MFSILGRMCLSLIFILSGIQKVMNWDATEQFFVNSLMDFVAYTHEWNWAQNILHTILPSASYLLVAGTIFEILGGLLIFFSIHLRFGAMLLALFLIPTTIIFHCFWWLEGPARELQMIMFLKNLSIFGAMLLLLGKQKKTE